MIIRHPLLDAHILSSYGRHLKALSPEDKRSRFGIAITDYGIDQVILNMLYHPDDHQLWIAVGVDTVGFGHMARNVDDSWELAVSVEQKHQRNGIGDKLIEEMIVWAKTHNVQEVFMHCIEENKVIQHLASKHKLKTRERSFGERTAAIEVPSPNLLEVNTQRWKEQSEIINQITELRGKLMTLWFNKL